MDSKVNLVRIFPVEKDKILRPLRANLFLTSAQADSLSFLRTKKILSKEFLAKLDSGTLEGFPVYYEKGTTPASLKEEITISFRVIKFFKLSETSKDFEKIFGHTPLVEDETIRILLVSNREL